MTRFDYNSLSKRHECVLFKSTTEYTHTKDRQQQQGGYPFVACRRSFLYLADGGERAKGGLIINRPKGVIANG